MKYFRKIYILTLLLVLMFASIIQAQPKETTTGEANESFEGRYFSGKGDVEYLQLLEISRRMFGPDAEFQNISMLYEPKWNGFVEGPVWGAWWVQNSYGPTYCALPFYTEPYTTFLQNSQDLWFDQMGNGRTVSAYNHWNGKWTFDWVPPDGSLPDCASHTGYIAKQGDGRVDIHDWGMEFTAAGGLMQTELLLISRDEKTITNYLPKLERCANFIETRRDPKNNLFLVGPAGNLLAPSYAAWKKPDGTYDKAYLTGLSVTYIAFLDRLIELEKLAGNQQKAIQFKDRRDAARKGLALLTTDDGYFIKYLDPDGTKHGVYGAEKHGYFEAVCNHDAICFRVTDDAQSEKIYSKIAAIPELRPHSFIITNYPSLDDMYVSEREDIWAYGEWIDGGHWSTCEARMIMGYYRLGKYDDARRSMQQLMKFAAGFRMDNPLSGFGSRVYHPHLPINLCYDSFGPPAAMVRGLFEYLYRADGLTLLPHIPTGISQLEQKFPIRFGRKKIFLSTVGTGPVTALRVNDKDWESFDSKSIFLSYEKIPDVAYVQIALGNAKLVTAVAKTPEKSVAPSPAADDEFWKALPPELRTSVVKIDRFYYELVRAGIGETYEAAHAKLIVDCISSIRNRLILLRQGKLKPLPEASQTAADKSYIDAAQKLSTGLEDVLKSYAQSIEPDRKRIDQIWRGLYEQE
ncbi:MAG: hypothetical protein K8R35_06405 [Bacteroidales bacterium]|nr:hypothetical protein [Bacteroidales bacterium]